MPKPKGHNIDPSSNDPLSAEGQIKITSDGDIVVHDGATETTIAGGGTIPATDELDAIQSANGASAANPFRTLADIPPAPPATGGVATTAGADASRSALMGIPATPAGILAGMPTQAEIATLQTGLMCYWDGNASPIPVRIGGTDQLKAVPSCDGSNYMVLRDPVEHNGIARAYVQQGEVDFAGHRSFVGGEATGRFRLCQNGDPARGTLWLMHQDAQTFNPPNFQKWMQGNQSAHSVLDDLGVMPTQAVMTAAGLQSGIGNSAGVRGRIATGECTMSTWFKSPIDWNTETTGYFEELIQLRSASTVITTPPYQGLGYKFRVLLGHPPASNRNAIVGAADGSLWTAESPPTVPGEWNNVVMTFNDATATAKWYLNSVLIETADYSAVTDQAGLVLQSTDGAYRGMVGHADHMYFTSVGNSSPLFPALSGVDPYLEFTGMGAWNRELTQADIDAIWGNNGKSYHIQKSNLWRSLIHNYRSWDGR